MTKIDFFRMIRKVTIRTNTDELSQKESAVFPIISVGNTADIFLLYSYLILRSAEFNSWKVFDIIVFFANTITFRDNFVYFFCIALNRPESGSLYFRYQSSVSIFTAVVEKDNIPLFRCVIGWKIIRKITEGNIRPIF